MSLRFHRFLFYFGVLFVCAIIAIFGLILTIKTNRLNDEIQVLSKEIRQLEEKNQRLELSLIQKFDLNIIEKLASGNMDMALPKQIQFIRIPAYDTKEY